MKPITPGKTCSRRRRGPAQGMGVTNLRILGATEGPDTEPWRIVPSLQPVRAALAEAGRTPAACCCCDKDERLQMRAS